MADADDIPKFDEDEEGETGESTIAMASPSFDPETAGVPFPISNPPPGFGSPAATPPLENPRTAPVGFKPATPAAPFAAPRAPAPAPARAAAPAPAAQRAPAPAPTPRAPAPAPTPRAVVPAPTPAAPAGKPAAATPRAPATEPPAPAPPTFPTSSRRGGRSQTVIGIAPPAAGAKSPIGPGSPLGDEAPFGPPPTPGAPARTPAAAGALARPGTLAGTGLPSRPKIQPTASNASPGAAPQRAAPAPKPAMIVAVDAIPPLDQTEGHKNEPPTKAGTTEESLALFGLDEAAGAAARAAARGPAPGAHRPAPSPAGKANFAPAPSASGGLRPALGQHDRGEHTMTVTESELEIVRKPGPYPQHDEEESTRAVPREELLHGQDAQFIVGADAAGEDATLAVAPSANEANAKNLAAFAETLQIDSQPGGFPPSAPAATPAPRPNWNDPQAAWAPPSPGMNGPMSGPNAPPPNAFPHPPSSPNPYTPISGAHPQMMGGNPHMMGAPGSMQMPSSGQMAAAPSWGPRGVEHLHQERMYSQPGNPIPYPAHMAQGQQQAPWVAPHQGGKRFKISGQILLLAVVGFICLAVFITGIVLFATTKL